jgi:hypothetical protein
MNNEIDICLVMLDHNPAEYQTGWIGGKKETAASINKRAKIKEAAKCISSKQTHSSLKLYQNTFTLLFQKTFDQDG